ncbi:MAG: ABC transporter permease [Bacteroidales bacterium]|jgi:putative ABC transport system permease protein|nr:ABC transporter permease [Bacteroidales bacterium]
MLSKLLKTIWSHLTSNKIYTAINIGGLAIGIGCSLVIYKIISYESSFDSYHKNHENIYRLINEYRDPIEGIKYQEGQVHPLGEAIRNDFSGIDAVMTYYAAEGQISIENRIGDIQKYQENTGLVYAEPNIFKVFDFNFLAGNPSIALLDKGSVVISSSLAQKYFNLSTEEVDEAIGRSLIINNIGTLQVSGVISDPPMNTDLPFKIIANYKDQTLSNPYFKGGVDWQEANSATNCYILLSKGLSVTAFENQLSAFFLKYHEKDNTTDQKYVLQPLSELHSGTCNNYSKRQVPDKSLWILGIIGSFLIIIASINFVNLSAVQTTKRFKEIGIKKIYGESKPQSIFQFLLESVFISYIAAILGLQIARFLFIYLEGSIGYQLNSDLLSSPHTLIYLILLATIIGLLSGLYPSMIIAGMSSNVALKSSLSQKFSSVSLSIRRMLVIIQFTISLVLIIGTLVMNQQLVYFSNKDLGFNKEAILLATLPDSNKDSRELLKAKLLKYPEIEKVSYGTRSPLSDWKVNNFINYPSIAKDEYYANLKTADEDYFNLFKLKFIAGQNYSSVQNNGDVVVNRKLTELLGFNNPQKAIGELIEYGGNRLNIVGVVEDFHAQSLQKRMENVLFSNLSFNINEMAVKMNTTKLNLSGYQEIVNKVETEWDEVFQNDILSYVFFDDKIASLYKEEKNTSNLIQLFAIIAIFIGSLGLYGLITHIISQKTKEISIRKVNGAKVSEILVLLNKDFMIYFAIAFILACPIAYIIMDKWLQNFAYKTELSWWIFALAGSVVMAISLSTVSGQTFTAARRNPVDAFRHE